MQNGSKNILEEKANCKYLDSVQPKVNGRVVRTECPVVHYLSAHTFILSAALWKFLSFSIDKITSTFNSRPLERSSQFTEPVGSLVFLFLTSKLTRSFHYLSKHIF